MTPSNNLADDLANKARGRARSAAARRPHPAGANLKPKGSATYLTFPRPAPQRRGLTILLVLLWLCALLTVPARSKFEVPAWDVSIYMQAVHSLALGHDPYADAVAIQQQFHNEMALHPGAQVPFSYVYSPITLPILKLVTLLPLWFSGSVYWLCYLAGLLAQIWGGLFATEGKERRFFLYLAPVAAFFPGFLASDILWSGNVAFLLYGMVLGCAILGWRRGNWVWFYVAVVLASCVKAPLLSLLAIPVFSARRQWIPAGISAAAGLALFGGQRFVWPSLFQHYLQAVELQFSYNRDFGCSPAGLFSGFLFDRGLPYAPASYIFYLYYALPLCAMLYFLSRRFLRGCFTLRQWIPVLLVGVILLNPRILEYDEIVLALPLKLIEWLFAASYLKTRWAIVAVAGVFLAANCIAYQNWNVWKLTEGPLLVVFFLLGCWNLLRQTGTSVRTGRGAVVKEWEAAHQGVPTMQMQASEVR